MNNLVAYSFENKVFRTQLTEEGEPLFCLADICEALELTNPTHAANAIKEEFSCPTLNVGQVSDPSGAKSVTFITEPQLYFILMRSRAEKAKPFRQWVVNEVLPAIRKKGCYTLKENKKDILLRKLEFLKLCLSTENITEEQHAKMLEALRKEYANP